MEVLPLAREKVAPRLAEELREKVRQAVERVVGNEGR